MLTDEINKNTNPEEGRAIYRQDLQFSSSTFGLYQDHIQTNIAILPSDVADDFAEFCRRNWSSCPLLNRSKDGEVSASLLAQNSDIRTDVPAYNVYVKGELLKTAPNLLEYKWDEMVTFYLGCSFSFDSKLLEKGILNLGKSKNIPMYATNISCKPVNCFSTPMVVSLRIVSKDQLEETVNITKDMEFCHGAPIHIGRPEDIGITDITKATYGQNPQEWSEDDVPVFWACGVTSALAVHNAKLPVSFSHSPGCMFVTDVKSSDADKLVQSKTYPQAKVVCLDEGAARYSIVSQNAWSLLEEIGESIHNRADFTRAVLSLSKSQQIYVAMSSNPTDQEINNLIHVLFALLKLNKTITLSSQNSKVKSILHKLFGNYINKSLLFDDDADGSKNETHAIFIGAPVKQESSVVSVVIGDHGIGTFKLNASVQTGLALAVGLFVALSCPLHDRYQRNGIGFQSNWNFHDLIVDQDEISAIFIEHGIDISADFPDFIKKYASICGKNC